MPHELLTDRYRFTYGLRLVTWVRSLNSWVWLQRHSGRDQLMRQQQQEVARNCRVIHLSVLNHCYDVPQKVMAYLVDEEFIASG